LSPKVEQPSSPRPLYALLLLWGALAAAAGAAGWVESSPFPPPAIAGALVLAGLAAWALSIRFRAWVRAVPMGALVAIHLVRFVGAWFIVLYRRGDLPFAFAVPGGWGDILAGASAVALLLGAIPARTAARRLVVLAWNVFGLLDILFVVFTAARLYLADPQQLAPLSRLPLSLLPTYFVPLVVLTHLRIFGWLREARARKKSNGV
jgi:hypothetical protein